MLPDIRQWQKIDEDWLSLALGAGGVEAKVSSFEARRVGTGQIGDCVRFELNYVSAEPGAPSSVVGKFPSDSAESRQTGISLGNYHREVKFYQLLQEQARISTPRCYYTEVNEETHDFVLIMEDLAPAEQGDQLKGVDLATAKQVLIEGAKMHAAFWEDSSLDKHVWVNGTTHAPNPIQPDLIAALWKGFQERYGERVTPEAGHIGNAFSANLESYEPFREGARTLVHADFRPDNILFATALGGRPVTVVDWQSFGYGPGASDIGYFIAGAVPVEERRNHEAELLEVYTNELERQGAGPYPVDELKRHYVAGAYQHFLTAFFAAMLVTETPRGNDMFFKMLNGAVDLILDHDAQDWFS